VISLDEATWRSHVSWLASRATTVVGLDAVAAGPESAVALTFDDAFANFAGLAWPALREHGLPVTLFVVAERAGRTNQWAGSPAPGIPTLPLLDWDALGRLADAGVSLGSHSRSHPNLTRVSDAELEDQLLGSAETIHSRTGRRPVAFAYPYGAAGRREHLAAARHYAWAVTTEFRALGERESPAALPRLDAYYFRAPGRLEQWGSGPFRRYLWLRARARRVRQTLIGLGKRP
jgi:peptidoglycan/xylan/chitin deacetylase (PgdA/CDA1 family)